MTDFTTEAEAAAVYHGLHPETGVSYSQAVERGRRALERMSAAERSAAVRDGLLAQHAPPEQLAPGTLITDDGRSIDCPTIVVDEAAEREGYRVASVFHAGWLVRRARHGLRQGVVVLRGTSRQPQRPRHRREPSARGAGTGDDDPAADQAAA
jgi:hypothetical protein